MIERIKARLSELTASRDIQELEYARKEEQIKHLQDELLMRRRSLDMTHGSVKELESLLAEQELHTAVADQADQG